MNELTPERIAEIRALIDAVPEMEYLPVPFGYGHQNRIAELDKDGNWRVWDSNVILSDASCQLLVQGKSVIQELLEHIGAAEKQEHGHRQQFLELRSILSTADVDHISLSLAEAVRVLVKERDTLRQITFGA